MMNIINRALKFDPKAIAAIAASVAGIALVALNWEE
jgi:hypothetical protein